MPSDETIFEKVRAAGLDLEAPALIDFLAGVAAALSGRRQLRVEEAGVAA